jgi:hypothetical protein
MKDQDVEGAAAAISALVSSAAGMHTPCRAL